MDRSGVQISVQGLTHSYSSRGPVTFDQVNLESKPGEVLAIIGRSGCGKSTLLHIMAGLLAPTAGSIRLNNIEVKEPSPKWVMMFQAPHLFPWMQVSQNVGIGLKFANFAEDKIRERVEKTIKLVDLEEYAESNVQDLSGGQQQRIAIARALLKAAPVLILDEATSALDNESEALVQLALDASRAGRTTVVVAHRLSTIESADRVLVMDSGQVVAQGSHAELLDSNETYRSLHQQGFTDL